MISKQFSQHKMQIWQKKLPCSCNRKIILTITRQRFYKTLEVGILQIRAKTNNNIFLIQSECKLFPFFPIFNLKATKLQFHFLYDKWLINNSNQFLTSEAWYLIAMQFNIIYTKFHDIYDIVKLKFHISCIPLLCESK